jgi:hypothetical protein
MPGLASFAHYLSLVWWFLCLVECNGRFCLFQLLSLCHICCSHQSSCGLHCTLLLLVDWYIRIDTLSPHSLTHPHNLHPHNLHPHNLHPHNFHPHIHPGNSPTHTNAICPHSFTITPTHLTSPPHLASLHLHPHTSHSLLLKQSLIAQPVP